jgi:uncharacterized membrane protein
METVRLLSFLIIMTLAIGTANAATIYGQAYFWETLEPIGNVVFILEKNGTEVQQIVSKDGSYSFEVESGDYKITARQIEKDLFAEENITVTSDVNYRFDVILFPNLEGLEPPEFPEELAETSKGEQPYYLIAIGLSSAVIAVLYIIKRRELTGEGEFLIPETPSELSSELPEDLRNVLEIIRKEGGRITQKELRKKLGYSEAKMSLIVADLERRGLIEKVKKGRGNIIFLKNL